MSRDECTCADGLVEPHSCPYAAEINEDDDPEYCSCCEECEYQCCMDI